MPNNSMQYNPYPKQEEVANRIFKLLEKHHSKKIDNYKDLDLFILTPPFRSLGDQNNDRYKKFIESIQTEHQNFMKHIQPNISRSYVDDRVIRCGTGATDNSGRKKFKTKNERQKFLEMEKLISSKTETLFFIIVDEAHFGATKESEFNLFSNKPNFEEKCRNVIILQVSATPYALLTKNSRIPDSNIINWFGDNEEENDYY